jgi:putative intracellular protease/amidase
MNVQVLLYDNFCMFEIATAMSWLSQFDVEAIALEDREHRSDAGLKVRPDRMIGELGMEAPDILVIPGGNPAKYLQGLTDPALECKLHEHLRRIVDDGKTVAAICGGPDFLARAGLLTGRRCTHGFERGTPSSFKGAVIVDQPVVVDGNIITARGNAFLSFGLAIMDHLSLFESEEEREREIAWYSKVGEFP